MKQKIVLFILLLSTIGFSNQFSLSTIVHDDQLVPIIKINGKTVIKVKTVGTKQPYFSSFERSEKIYNSLYQYKDQSHRLNNIRIRRKKSDYVAFIDNIEIYRVTPSDTIGSDVTEYQLAKQWRDSIEESLLLSQAYEAQLVTQDNSEEIISSPLMHMMAFFSSDSVFVFGLKVVGFILVQVITVALTILIMTRRYRTVVRQLKIKIRRFNQSQERHKSIITSLSNQLNNLEQKVDLDQRDSKTISGL